MTVLAFQKPDKVIMVDSDESFGKFEFRPLEPGYGITVGNALRRILLSSLEGYAITTVKVDGVEHEFSTITGVIEDVTEVILNLKQIRFKNQIDDVDDEKIMVTITGQEEFKAGDLNKFLSGFRVLNPELVICHMEEDVKLQLELTINKGRGYVPAEENKTYTLSAEARREQGNGGNIYLDFLNGNRQRIEPNSKWGYGSEWGKQTITAQAPVGTRYIRVVLYSSNGSQGIVYWDNVELKLNYQHINFTKLSKYFYIYFTYL